MGIDPVWVFPINMGFIILSSSALLRHYSSQVSSSGSSLEMMPMTPHILDITFSWFQIHIHHHAAETEHQENELTFKSTHQRKYISRSQSQTSRNPPRWSFIVPQKQFETQKWAWNAKAAEPLIFRGWKETLANRTFMPAWDTLKNNKRKSWLVVWLEHSCSSKFCCIQASKA